LAFISCTGAVKLNEVRSEEPIKEVLWIGE